MRNLLLLLVLANALYFVWEWVREEAPQPGVVIVEESRLGPPLDLSAPPRSASPPARPAVSRETEFAVLVGRSCVSIGPFTNGPDAERVLQDYREEGMYGEVRSTRGEVFVGHWVQIREVPTRDMADAMLARLIDGGLSDAYLVTNEDEGLRISLGLFGDLERAERVELQARSLNLPAEISPRTRGATVFYVDIVLPPGRGAGEMMERFGEERVLLRSEATCPGA